jgi:HTH-type transcriptional regulator/antitoxin HigA
MMDVKPLRTEQDYYWERREVTGYFEAEGAPGTPDGDRFEVHQRVRRPELRNAAR